MIVPIPPFEVSSGRQRPTMLTEDDFWAEAQDEKSKLRQARSVTQAVNRSEQ